MSCGEVPREQSMLLWPEYRYSGITCSMSQSAMLQMIPELCSLRPGCTQFTLGGIWCFDSNCICNNTLRFSSDPLPAPQSCPLLNLLLGIPTVAGHSPTDSCDSLLLCKQAKHAAHGKKLSHVQLTSVHLSSRLPGFFRVPEFPTTCKCVLVITGHQPGDPDFQFPSRPECVYLLPCTCRCLSLPPQDQCFGFSPQHSCFRLPSCDSNSRLLCAYIPEVSALYL